MQCTYSTNRPSSRHKTFEQVSPETSPIEEPIHTESKHKPNYKAAIIVILTAYGFTWAFNYYREPKKLDAPPSQQGDALTSGAKVELTGQDHADDVEKIPTGTSTVPYFPKTIWLPRVGGAAIEGQSPALPAGIGAAKQEEPYQLLGLGVRKVSFLRIEVYVVGIYVAKSDLGRLQERLVKASVGGGASTLVQGEKEELRKALIDGKGSEKIWSEVLKEGGVRSALRLVPTKGTGFAHLRDGWLRRIDAGRKMEAFNGEDISASRETFKNMFEGKGSVAKGRCVLMGRGTDGALRVFVEENSAEASQGQQETMIIKGNKMSLVGTLEDEKIGRLVWMGYLAGKEVASEAARQSVAEGIMDIVERPIGTAETQVV